MQDAAVSIIFELVKSIDAAQQRYATQRSVAGHDLRRQLLTRFQFSLQPPYSYGLVALQPQRRPRSAVLEGQRQHAHADEMGAMNAPKALKDSRAAPEQPGPLRAPVARRAVAVFGAREYHQRYS